MSTGRARADDVTDGAGLDLATARDVLAAQPFSVLIGAELTRFEPGVAELRIPLRAELLQQFGFAHGGLVAYAADNALSFVGGSVLGPSVVTRGFAIDYVRPAQGDALVAVAEVVSPTRRQAVCRCEVYAVTGGDRTLCAAAQGTVNRIDLG